MPAVTAKPRAVQSRTFRAHAAALDEVQIPTSDGVLLAGAIGKPTKARKREFPVVVMVHGFCGERTENGLFSELTHALLRRGYFVVLYDWRGLRESSGDFSNTSLEKHAEDFRSVVEWAESRFNVKRTRMCAIGFSLGATLIAMATGSGLQLGAAAFLSPAIRPCASMWPRYDTSAFRKQLREKGFIIKPETGTRLGRPILRSLRKTDLGASAFTLGLPLLVCHGTLDVRIPFETTRETFAGLGPDVNVYFAEFRGASHSFRPQAKYWNDLVALVCAWLDEADLRTKRTHKVLVPRSRARR